MPANWLLERKTTALMVVSANFRGVNTPTTADFKLAVTSLQVELGRDEQRGSWAQASTACIYLSGRS